MTIYGKLGFLRLASLFCSPFCMYCVEFEHCVKVAREVIEAFITSTKKRRTVDAIFEAANLRQ